MSAPCRMLHSPICKRRVGWGWTCSALSASRCEYWLPESLGGPSSGKGSGHSQGGVPPLRQITHSDWQKEGLQPIGPLALSRDSSEGDSASLSPPRPPLLSSFQVTPPRCLPNWHMAASPFQVCFQGTFLETGVQLEQWSKKYNEAVFWFPFLQNERRVHKGKRQPGKCSKEAETQTKEKAANWGWWSTVTKNAEKEWELGFSKVSLEFTNNKVFHDLGKE